MRDVPGRNIVRRAALALPVLMVLFAVWMATPARADTVTLEGTVISARGKPAKGVDVATMWLEGDPAGGVKTDADGAFVLEARSYGRPLSVLVMDKKRKHGALAVIEPDRVGDHLELTLEPLVRVNGTFTCEELGAKPTWTNVYLNLRSGNLRIARHMSEKAEFSFRVPVGAYDLVMYGTDVQQVRKPLVVEGSKKSAIDLGALDLRATPIAKLYDEVMPPWTVTDAWGVDGNVTLEDYRGKWVLLEFWFST